MRRSTTQPAKAKPAAQRKRCRQAQGVVDLPPPTALEQLTPPSPAASARTPPPEDEPAPPSAPPSAQPPSELDSSPPPSPEVSRSRRNTESLEREFVEPINWTLQWSIKLNSRSLYSDGVSVVDKAASALWSEIIEPIVRDAFHHKGISRFELQTFKVTAKLSRRGVRKVDYTRASLDWSPLDDTLRSWSLRYPAEQKSVEFTILYASRDPPRATPRASTTINMLEDLSQQAEQAPPTYASNHAQLPKNAKGQQGVNLTSNLDRQLLSSSGVSLPEQRAPVLLEIRSSPLREEMSIDQALGSYIDWQKEEVQKLTWKEKLEEAFDLLDEQCMDLHTLKTKTPEWLVSQGVVQGVADRLIRDIERWKRYRNERLEGL
ncbi:Hypothetical protein D9617_85g015890 [Elsinoe fawcettii]|nr:Hypothetical protein D9617_85g015890 [Elsinoe fawcettii]